MEPILVTISESMCAFAHLADGVEIVEAGAAYMQPIGNRRTVADDEIAQLALASFDGVVDHARRDAEAFGHQLEVVDQRFHAHVEFGARRQADLAVVGPIEAVGQVFDAPAR